MPLSILVRLRQLHEPVLSNKEVYPSRRKGERACIMAIANSKYAIIQLVVTDILR